MKLRNWKSFALAILTVASSSVFATEYIVKYKDSSLVNAKSFLQATIVDEHPEGQYVVVDINEKNELMSVANIMSNDNVEYIVENVKVYAITAPLSDIKGLKEQWHIAKVNAEKAWEIAGNRGSKNIKIAVIDTGIDYNHPSLKPNMIPGYDFRASDDDPMDETGARNPGHGTHCGGIAAATGLVEGGTIGLSPEVSLMPIRFLGADGSGDLNNGIKAIDYAISKGIQVMSNSWGATISASQAQPLTEAIKRASDAGVIVVNAAANDGRSNDSTSVYPANAVFENTITVAASGPNDEKPSWSNYGKRNVSLAAPGLNIMSTLPANKYQNLSGTSMATPLVSGLVALVKAQNPDLTGLEVRSLLQKTGAKVGIETACNCRVDAAAAIQAVKDQSMIVTPAAWSVEIGKTAQFGAMNSVGTLRFESSNTAAATIDASGLLTGVADGTTIVSVSDSEGKTAQSLDILVFKAGDDGGGGTCPIGDQAMCDILCGIMPTLPFCNGL